MFDYHSMNKALVSESDHRGSKKRKKSKYMQKSHSLFINKLSSHNLNGTDVFSEEELDE